MNQQINTRNPALPRRRASLDPVAFTALVYLREALLDERYEECAEIVKIAREFGAPEIRIGFLLEDPRRGVNA